MIGAVGERVEGAIDDAPRQTASVVQSVSRALPYCHVHVMSCFPGHWIGHMRLCELIVPLSQPSRGWNLVCMETPSQTASLVQSMSSACPHVMLPRRLGGGWQ